jgi:hypothetical protein
VAAAEPERALEVLDLDTCWRLLRGEVIGRLAVPRPAHGPLVVPVTFRVDDLGNIAFRTAAGTKLGGLAQGHASLQVDGIDAVHRTGWSVLVDGLVLFPSPEDPSPDPWLPDLPTQVTLVPVEISGRAVVLRQLDTDERGYR